MSNNSLLTLPPLSLYVHIPWCVRKCPYCDFNSHENHENLPEAAYLNKLKQDLEQDNPWVEGRPLRSIFFGGGTPSLFSAKTIAAILNTAETRIGFDSNIEITLEANPGTFEQEKFADYFHAGVNRLSIGVQSFSPLHLEKLGRIHNREEAIHAIQSARKAGFDNINIDLMHGLPEQTIENANRDLLTAIDLAPSHISWYQLTIEPNTVFYRQPPPLPPEEALADIQDSGHGILADHGYQQYEISAYSQPNKQSKHNLNYWSFGDYLGIGAGAHGKYTDINNKRILRKQKTRLPEHYLEGNGAPKAKETTVATEELTLEFFMNILRLREGVPVDYFSSRTGLALTQIQPTLDTLIKKGLLEHSGEYLKASPLGQRFLNTLLSYFDE